MGRQKTGKIEKTTRAMVAVAQAPLSFRERLNGALLPLAYLAGAVGMLALGACGLLWILPPSSHPAAVDTGHLPYYTMVALLLASLLGWGCMQKGLGRLRSKVGWTVGGWLFVGLPMACAGILVAHSAGWVDLQAISSEWAGPTVEFATWYPPGLVVASLLAYVLSRTREGGREQKGLERGAWFTLLVAPYALLMAYLVVGFNAPWLDDRLEDTIHELGSGAIVVQVALAYFCGGGGSAS